MTLTEKEIKTLEAFKGTMEYVEVEAIGVGGVKVMVKKLVKVVIAKERKKSTTPGGFIPDFENDGIRKFVKTENEFADQKRANEMNLPSSMRK